MKYNLKRNDFLLENGEVYYELGVDQESLDNDIFCAIVYKLARLDNRSSNDY